MDELKITSKFMTKMLSKLIEVTIKKKLGYKVNIQVNELNVTFNNGMAHFGVNVEGSADQNEFMKIMKLSGLED